VSEYDAGGTLSLLGDSEFLALAGTAFARAQAYSTVLIALALYADQFATSSAVEGLFGTSFALAQIVIVLPLGRYIDLGNAKRYLLAGLLLNVLVFVGFSLVGRVEHVLVVRVVQGVGASLLWLTGSAVVGEISPDGGRGHWLGVYNQVGAFSSLAGDVVGGLLLYVYGFRVTYAVLIAVTLVATALVYWNLRDDPGGRADPEEATGVETLRSLMGRTAVRALVVFRLAFSVGKMTVIIFLPIYAKTAFDINPFAIGGILAGGKLTKSLLQGYVGELTDGVEDPYVFVLAGAVTYALGTVLVPFAAVADRALPATTVAFADQSMTLPAAFWALFAAYAILGVADSLRLPASMSLFVEEGERFDAVAASMSLRSIAWKAGQVSGPALVGVLWDLTNAFVAFTAAAGFLLVAAGLFAAMYQIGEAPNAVAMPAE
jgi:DHA1 family multidrug resistance protein-like MFS transporter